MAGRMIHSPTVKAGNQTCSTTEERNFEMSTIDIIGSGVMRWPEADGYSSATGMVALHHPETGHRLTLSRVPVGRTGLLIAVLASSAPAALADTAGFHTHGVATVSVVLASGTVVANQPAPGIGPADLVGCTPDDGAWCWLDPAVISLATDREVRLEIHRGCTCKPKTVTVATTLANAT
jgi:hypothetical protein